MAEAPAAIIGIGDRAIVVANHHNQREARNLVGRTGKVREVWPYPIDRVRTAACGLATTFSHDSSIPSALARLDPEVVDPD